MDLRKVFTEDWKENFPDFDTPDTSFLSSGALIKERISESEGKIQEAELLIKKEEFIIKWILAHDVDSLVKNYEHFGDPFDEQSSTPSNNTVSPHVDRDKQMISQNATRENALSIEPTSSRDRLELNDFSKQEIRSENPTVTERTPDNLENGELSERDHPWTLRQHHSAGEESTSGEAMSQVSTADVIRRRHSSDEKYSIQRQHRINRFYSDKSPKRFDRPVIRSKVEPTQENRIRDTAESAVTSTSNHNVLPSTTEIDEAERQDSSPLPSGADQSSVLEKYTQEYGSSDGLLSNATERPKPLIREPEDSVLKRPCGIDIINTGSRESMVSEDSSNDTDGDGIYDEDEEEDVIYVNLQELKLGIHRRLRSRDGSDLSESGDSEVGSQNDLHLIGTKEPQDRKGYDSDDSNSFIGKEIDQKQSGPGIPKKTPLRRIAKSSSGDNASPPPPKASNSAAPELRPKPDVSYLDEKDSYQDDDKGDKMRRFLVFNLLDSEKCYVDCLDMLCKYMKPFLKSTETSMPILSVADYNKIFFGIEDMYRIHKEFMNALEPRVEYWTDGEIVGDLFSGLMDNLQVYRQFVSNYKGAMETMLKCRNANETFDAIVKKEIKIPSLKDSIKLDGLLYKPVDRITQYSLMLNDLLKYTADDHPDRPLLIEVTGTLFDLFETVSVDRSRKGATQRQLLKEGYAVELVDGVRKPRQLFLFSDILMCAKLKAFKEEYNCKWYVSLVDISLKPIKKSDQPQPVPVTMQGDVDRLRASIANTRAELRREQLILAGALSSDGSPSTKRKNQSSFSSSSTRGGSNKNLEKLRKKLAEQENVLTLVAPSLPWTIYHTSGKTYTLLLTSEEERQLWKEALSPRIRKMRARGENPVHLSNYEIHQALETCLKVQRLGARFGAVLPSPHIIGKDEKEESSDLLTGFLYVKIHGCKLFGRQTGDMYCALEVDSYGHFFRKGKTKNAKGPDPVWDEDFEIEIEAARSLRVLCCTRARLMGDDVCGRINIDLLKENLGDFRHHSLTLTLEKQGVVTMSISFSTTPEGIQRTKSVTEGVFGVPVRVLTRREQFDIPLIVITCVKEVEKRGLNEVGIYRLSGIASEVQYLKKAFDENPQSAVVAVAEADVHAVAGLLKLYFRELPEALFTDKLYHKFLDGLQLSEADGKEVYMVDLLEQLPRPNKMTALYLMEHLRKVNENADINKMNLNNLATVFGPNVLRPSEETEKTRKKSTAGFDIGALDVMSQVSIFRYFLTLKSERVKLPDDLDIWRRLDPQRAKKLEEHLLATAEEYLI